MNFLKDLCQGKKDDYIHQQFTRFGRGDYKRLIFTIRRSKNLSVHASYDFANELFHIAAMHCKENVAVKGKIVTNYNFEKEVTAEKFSKRGKMYTAEINGTYSPKQLQEMYETFKNHHLLLSFKGDSIRLSCKTGLPKPGSEPKDNFCSATLPVECVDEFAFDFENNFGRVDIVHTLHIDDVVIPKEYQNDFAQARIHAIRKGKLIREITIDGNQVRKEYPLEV
ncbi:MAG TPA: hypothetical protein VJJ79_00325 [Candidatus Nanoarchaeia archaeon]|nr:hypothetical protein [Candidatus Nanoarchaeia archaeon]